MRDQQQDILPERQVFEVVRIEDNTFIGVYYTWLDANELKTEYESTWNEPCRIARSYILGVETVAQRKANEQEQ